MIKNLMTCRVNNILQQYIKHSFAELKTSVSSQKANNSKLKPYQIMLRNNIENSIKFPSAGVFKLLRSRAITKIMASNHNIDDTEQVLEAHIECLYALINRIQPSIEAISMFAEAVYGYLEELREPDITNLGLLNLLKPTVMTKLVRISQSIEIFYNEAFRTLISTLVIKLLKKSVKNEQENQRELRNLSDIIKKVKEGSKDFSDEEGNTITLQNLEVWSRKRIKQINQSYMFLNSLDYWNGFQFVLSMEYYTDEFLLNNMIRLQKTLEKDLRLMKMPQLMVKIKAITELHRFKSVKEVSSRGLRVLFLAYNKLMQQYFKILSQQSSLLQLISAEQPIIQVQLLTNFLTQEHYEKAKKTYMDIFKAALNVSKNGVLLIDVNRLRGFFEVIITLYGHEDTKDIHALLTQLEKVMMMYPLERFDKLSAHCYVCDKFGYKSDFFAQKFFKYLTQQHEKLERNRGHLHHVHQVTRQINLAKNFLLYIKIGNKLSKQQIDAAQRISSTLFDPNVWYLLTENDPFSQSFLLASSFSSYIYFTRTGIYNLTSNGTERRRIERTCSQIGLKNINRQYGQLLEDLRVSSTRHTLKLDHHSNWRHNPYARMCNLLELANNHYNYLKKNSPKDATNFIQQFLSKSLGSTLFYNTMKQRFAFPGVIQNFIDLMEKANTKSFPIQNRDLQAIKRLYHAQLTKIVKENERPMFVHYYQEHLDTIELNRVIIPSSQQIYGLPSLGNSASKSLLYHAMRRFQKQKEYLRMQIDTFLKFNKTVEIEVTVNYLELPHLADLLVKTEDETTAILFRSYEGEPNHFLNYKQTKMQREAEEYWRKKQYQLYVIKGVKEIQDFMKKITKQQAYSAKK